jgi:hypothetical protein
MPKKLIPTQPVNSSNIKAIGYDEGTRTLQIDFYNGSKYHYSPITLDGFTALKEAESLGKYFAEHIRTNKTVTCEKVEGI